MKIEGLFGSERAYYKQTIYYKSQCRLNRKATRDNKSKDKPRNSYYNKQFEKNKLRKLQGTSAWWTVLTKYNEYGVEYKTRCYLSNGRVGRCRMHKKLSNKKVRKYKGEISNGGHYRKIYDHRKFYRLIMVSNLMMTKSYTLAMRYDYPQIEN